MLLGVLEEHLEEAELLARRREAALWSDTMDLADLDALEMRLDAHLDAIAISGEGALTDLRANPDGSSPYVAFAWAASCLRSQVLGLREAVLRVARGRGSSETRGILSALCYAALDPSVRDRLAGWLNDAEASEACAALEVLSFHRELPPVPMEPFSRSRDVRVRTSAGRAIGRMRRSDEWQTLDVLMRDRDLGVRDAALEAALRVRVPHALVHLRACCEDDDTRTVDSLRLLACVGGQSDAIVLRGSVEVSPLGEASLSGLGTLGYAACATHLVELMEYPSWARGAAAAFERITGLACTPRHVGPLSLQEEEDTFEDLRPVPDASAVRRMWENRLASFDRGTRCRRGQPLRAETWVADSSHGSLLTRREELFRLWATSPTQCRDVVLDAPAGRQRAASLEGSKP